MARQSRRARKQKHEDKKLEFELEFHGEVVSKGLLDFNPKSKKEKKRENIVEKRRKRKENKKKTCQQIVLEE